MMSRARLPCGPSWSGGMAALWRRSKRRRTSFRMRPARAWRRSDLPVVPRPPCRMISCRRCVGWVWIRCRAWSWHCGQPLVRLRGSAGTCSLIPKCRAALVRQRPTTGPSRKQVVGERARAIGTPSAAAWAGPRGGAPSYGRRCRTRLSVRASRYGRGLAFLPPLTHPRRLRSPLRTKPTRPGLWTTCRPGSSTSCPCRAARSSDAWALASTSPEPPRRTTRLAA
mmetsp:Transcript_86710/g.280199  ORF Transcript_86710/g.280199 Transcript_86710/m.280199 type:complete len:225 (+) Transcript_86710:351-1025(+)